MRARTLATHAALATCFAAGAALAVPPPPGTPATVAGPPGATLHNAAEPGAGAFGAQCSVERPCSAGLTCMTGRCLAGSTAPEMQWVAFAGGPFTMGAKGGAGQDAEPPRPVTVPAFELGRTEVTVAQYRLCMAAGKCTAPAHQGYNCNLGAPDREQHPINCVSWDQAQAFATFVGGRLPSEAEWEFAATSGGKDQAFPWGDAVPEAQHAVAEDAFGKESARGTAPVCSKPAGNSAQGLCDLAGNVSEWVADGYGPYAEAPKDGSARADMPPPKDSKGCDKCAVRSGRVHRGGHWASQALYLQAKRRDALLPDDPHNTLGFRVARTPR